MRALRSTSGNQSERIFIFHSTLVLCNLLQKSARKFGGLLIGMILRVFNEKPLDISSIFILNVQAIQIQVSF